MTPVIGRNRTMTEPDFHDGQLLGMVLSPDREDLTLLCRRVDGRDFSLTLPRIVRLRVDNFLEANIIYELSIRERDRPPQQAVHRLWNYDTHDCGGKAQYRYPDSPRDNRPNARYAANGVSYWPVETPDIRRLGSSIHNSKRPSDKLARAAALAGTPS